MKVAIVGGGIVGLSTAWALKRAGCDVSVIEQGPLPNPLGSSVDQHRLIRYPYGVQRGYLRMVREAYHAWERVWSDLKMRLYAETGTLVLSGEGDSWAKQSCIALAAEEVEHLAFDGETVAGRYPMLNGDGLQDAYYCPSGGLLFAEAIVAALLTDADRYTWVAATIGANNAAGYQLAAERPVLAVGGFNGSDPFPTPDQFQRLVADGQIHWFIDSLWYPNEGGSTAAQEIAAWVHRNYRAQTIDGVRFYDLTQPDRRPPGQPV